MWALRRLRHLINTTDDVMKALKSCAPLPENPSSSLTAAAPAATASPQKSTALTPYQSGALVGLPTTAALPTTPSLVRSPVMQTTPTSGLAALVQSLPEMLLRQFEYEDSIVRGGKHLLHSPFFKVRWKCCDAALV